MTDRDDEVDAAQFGVIFPTAYTGTMFGAGLGVHAVWPYIIAHMRRGKVELNPRIVAVCLGCTSEVVADAIEWLQRPDPNSKTPLHAGKRLHHLGGFIYHVPGAKRHRNIVRRLLARIASQDDENGSATKRSEVRANAPKCAADDDVLTKGKAVFGEKSSELQERTALNGKGQQQDTEASRGIQPAPTDDPQRLPRRKGSLPPYDAVFEEAWSLYGPLRSGHSKLGAWRQWLMRVREGYDAQAILAGAKRAAEYHRRIGTPPTKIKHFETFVGPDRHFENDYTVRDDGSSFRKPSHRADADESYARQLEANPKWGRMPAPDPNAPEPSW